MSEDNNFGRHHQQAKSEAAKFLFGQERLVVEFSGAATVAALRSGRVQSNGRTVVAIVSGGNADPGMIANL